MTMREDAAFVRIDPAPETETPVLVEVPHAGLFVPEDVRATLVAPEGAIARDADNYVDELFADAPLEGATLLAGRPSRYVVDLNRAEQDIDSEAVAGAPSHGRAPRGVIWRLTGEGAKILAAPLSDADFQARLRAFHRPYHEEVTRILRAKRERFGIVVLLAAHSMPSRGRTANGEVGPPRADVVPGTRGRTTAAACFIDMVESHALAHRLSVRHDDPYRGGYTTAHYGQPALGIHAVQVELARRLYMDEASLVRTTQFADVRAWCRALVAQLAKVAETALR